MTQLPPNVVKGIEALGEWYGSVDSALAAILDQWDGKDPAVLLKALQEKIGTLDKAAASFVQLYTAQVVQHEWRVAEKLLGAPELNISADMLAKVQSRFYKTFAQQNATIRTNAERLVHEGYKAGSSLYDGKRLQRLTREQGISGLKRSDGSTLSVRATGKAMVRTRVVQLQAESQVERYKAAGVTHVEFHSGGKVCRYRGEGGPCSGLSGRVFPVDAIPEWARIPRHLYSQSRYLPVVEGMDTSGSREMTPAEAKVASAPSAVVPGPIKITKTFQQKPIKAEATSRPLEGPPKKGDRVEFSGGHDAVSGKPVLGGKASVVEVKGDSVMLNAGTPSKPKWVTSSVDRLAQPVRKTAQRSAQTMPLPKPFDRPALKSTDLRNHLGQSKATLDLEARKAVKQYTGNDFLQVNSDLRRGYKPELAKRMDRAFEQVTPTTEPAILYRGVQASRFAGKLEPGKVLVDKGFSSMTVRKNVGEEFAKGADLLEVEVPPGARLIDVNRTSGSNYGGEAEILPPRNTKLVVTEIVERPGKPRLIKARMVVE